MADLSEQNTPTNNDAGQVGSIAPVWRLRILQVVAVVLIIAAIVLLLRGLLTPAPGSSVAAGSKTPGPTATAAPADPLVGHYAPDVTLHDLHNTPVTIASLRGKVVLLNFWYVSCAPCQIEMPTLERSYLAHQAQGFEVVGINVADDTQTISTFTSRLGINYPMLRDTGRRAVLAYDVRATPSSYLIDRSGVIRAVYIGSITSMTTLNQQVATLLATH